MNLRKLGLIILAGALLLSVNSCKDDDDTTVSPSLGGALTFSLPPYVKPESKVTITPRGVTHPDDKEIGYYWKVTPTMTKYDTTRFENGLDKNGLPSDGSFTHTFSDTLQTYTVYAYAYAEGYAASSQAGYCAVVEGGVEKSITNRAFGLNDSIEKINGKDYYYATIGDTDWMKENLDFTTAGIPYLNCIAMSDVFGRYYSYEEALTVCPEGWTLPSDADWVALGKAAGADENTEAYGILKGVASKLMVNAYFNGNRMWEYWPAVGDLQNNTGFSAIPTGFVMFGQKNENPETDQYLEYNYPNAIFKGIYEYAAFWTADAVADEEGMAYYRYLIVDQPDMMISKGDTKSFGAAVRCIRKK